MSISVKTLCRQTEEALADLEFPAFEAKELCRHIFGCSDADLLLGKEVTPTPEQLSQLQNSVARRKNGEPLQYLLGEWDFYRRKFFVGPGVLIPRADTEVLIEAVLPFLRESAEKTVLDLCSGSGCIAITLALEQPDVNVTAVELSVEAFPYLQKNNALYGDKVAAVFGDALAETTAPEQYALIVSNPPYLSDEDMAVLQKEVSFEPAMALYGESDGLYFYRELTRLYAPRLINGGMLAYEIGEGQQDAVAEIMEENGLTAVRYYKDYGNITRVVTATKERTQVK